MKNITWLWEELVVDNAKNPMPPDKVCGFFDLVLSITRKNQIIPLMHVPISGTACTQKIV